MGCGGSKAVDAADGTASGKKRSSVEMAEEAADRLEQTEELYVGAMSADVSQRVSGLFKSKTGQDEMTESEFKAMLPDVPPDTVGFLFRLFDKDHSGKVGSREFLLAMGLLPWCGAFAGCTLPP